MNIVVEKRGIDVSKKELVLGAEQGKATPFPNTVEGCAKLISVLPPNCDVHLESTGGYERLAVKSLKAAGIEVVVHNPLAVRLMSRAKGTKAKTDPVDAKSLAKIGDSLPAPALKAPDRQGLADFSRAIDVLKEQVAQMKKRLKMPELDQQAKDLYAGVLKDLKARLAQAEKDFRKRVTKSSVAKDYKFAMSVPSIGQVAARKCVCELPEDFHSRSAQEICSYAGLAPMNNQSGSRVGRSRLGRGNSRLKGCFYMPALSAIKCQAWAKALYSRLRAEGRCHQSAIVAVMRRLLLRVLSVLKRGEAWEKDPPKRKKEDATEGGTEVQTPSEFVFSSSKPVTCPASNLKKRTSGGVRAVAG